MGAKKYDNNTINFEDIQIEEKWGKMTPTLLNKIIDMNSYGQKAIRGILNLLNNDKIDHRLLLGELKYRYMIKCSQNQLAKLVGIEKSNFSKGIRELEEYNLIIRKDGIIYIHPLLLNKNTIIDKRTLKMFNIKYIDKKETNISREKVDKNKIRKDLIF